MLRPTTDLDTFNIADLNGDGLVRLSAEIFAANVAMGWWSDLQTGESLVGRRNVGELLMLCVSELCEGAEGLSENLMDDKLPHRQMIEVELADFMIRVLDLVGGLGIKVDLGRQYDGATTATIRSVYHEHLCSTPDQFLLRIIRFVSSAMECHRKSTDGMAVNLSFALHGVIILGEILELDVMGAVFEKRAFNATRADHQVANRLAVGGKRY